MVTTAKPHNFHSRSQIDTASGAMALTGQVCSVCQTVLCPGTRLCLEPDPESVYFTPAGQTFDTFREASQRNCVICSKIFNLSKRHRDAWSNASLEAWQPLQYRVEKYPGEESIVRLSVLYNDPLKNDASDLRFCLIPIDSAEYSARFILSEMESSTSAATTLAAAKKWFNHCHLTHERCHRLFSHSPDQLPTRLIDIGHDGDTDWFLRTVHEDIISSTLISYMTLSYRWGPNAKLALLSSTLDQFRKGAPICDLPQLFKDFITVTRKFCIRYVWIDALCIIQDSVEDWEAEASKMRYVYANSACNIAASASNNPEESMFRSREPGMILPRVVLSSLFANKPSLHYIFEQDFWDRQIFYGPLHNRGWVFQERFLAPRVLYFGKDQVLWECINEHKCESFPRGIPAHWSDKNIDPLLDSMSVNSTRLRQQIPMPLHLFNLWNDLVKRYSQCDLTNVSDKLFAIAGIAKLFGDATGDKYVAGWWKSRLLESLDWRVYEPRVRSSAIYRAPSWSWASVDGPVKIAGLSPSTEFLVELLEVHVTTRGPDETVNILEGYIKLKGIISAAVCRYNESGNCVLVIGNRQYGVWLYPDSLDINFPEGKKVVCIPLKKDYSRSFDGGMKPHVLCLLAEEVGIRHGSDVLYQRLGFFVLYTEEDIKSLVNTGMAVSSAVTLR